MKTAVTTVSKCLEHPEKTHYNFRGTEGLLVESFKTECVAVCIFNHFKLHLIDILVRSYLVNNVKVKN